MVFGHLTGKIMNESPVFSHERFVQAVMNIDIFNTTVNGIFLKNKHIGPPKALVRLTGC